MARIGRPANTPEHIWGRINRDGPLILDTRCWPWSGARNRQGYGWTRLNNRFVAVHRLVWEWTSGVIPDGLDVLHECDNPPCSNPSHLFLGTTLDNVADRDAKGRQAHGETHAWALHPERVPRGERNGHAVLTVRAVEWMRQLADPDTGALAEEYGVARHTIWKAITRRSWKSVA